MHAAIHKQRKARRLAAGVRVLGVLTCLQLLACGQGFRRPRTPVDPPTPPVGSWTLVALPDSQSTVKDHPEIFEAQTAWLTDNADRLAIKYVVHEGDITNNSNDEQWGRADRAFRHLDGRVPYALAMGNHDYPGDGRPKGRDATKLDGYFPLGRMQAQPGFVGAFEPTSGANAAYRFQANGQDWLILSLEFGPRDSVLDWAASLLAAHPDAHAIVVTHAYLATDGTRQDHVAGIGQRHNPHDYNRDGRLGSTNDGQEIWDKLIAQRPNIRLVLCGHMHGQARLTSMRPNAPPVHQVLADYQAEALGGAGYLRLMTFGPDGNAAVRTYSPYLRHFRSDADNEFVLGFEP